MLNKKYLINKAAIVIAIISFIVIASGIMAKYLYPQTQQINQNKELVKIYYYFKIKNIFSPLELAYDTNVITNGDWATSWYIPEEDRTIKMSSRLVMIEIPMYSYKDKENTRTYLTNLINFTNKIFVSSGYKLTFGNNLETALLPEISGGVITSDIPIEFFMNYEKGQSKCRISSFSVPVACNFHVETNLIVACASLEVDCSIDFQRDYNLQITGHK